MVNIEPLRGIHPVVKCCYVVKHLASTLGDVQGKDWVGVHMAFFKH